VRVILTGCIVFLLMMFSGTVMAENCGELPKPAADSSQIKLKLKIVASSAIPVLGPKSPGAEDALGGVEGGTVIKADGAFHAFITEMTSEIGTRLALWTSPDGDHWTRTSTLFKSSGDFTGQDRRASLWAPMPVYDDAHQVWNLFYVAYRSKPSPPTAWYANYDGEIVRAVSQVKGRHGYAGPYRDVNVILSPEKNPDSWEGLQGTDSFFPYRALDRWFGFYGTAHTEVVPPSSWRVGLAAAPSLHGPWHRCSSLNPSPFETHFIENPVVSRIGSTFLAIYDVADTDTPKSIGYSESQDGVYWTPGARLELFTDPAIAARTPLALIEDGQGAYDLFVTAYVSGKNAAGKDASLGHLFHFKVKAE
jgi:hypothetical protein